MKRQEVVEINNMNNHRNSLLAEQQKSKQLELSLANVSSKQLFMEESLAKLEAKLEQKRLLILKLRGVALYQESAENSRNKEVGQDRPPVEALPIGYLWPVALTPRRLTLSITQPIASVSFQQLPSSGLVELLPQPKVDQVEVVEKKPM